MPDIRSAPSQPFIRVSGLPPGFWAIDGTIINSTADVTYQHLTFALDPTSGHFVEVVPSAVWIFDASSPLVRYVGPTAKWLHHIEAGVTLHDSSAIQGAIALNGDAIGVDSNTTPGFGGNRVSTNADESPRAIGWQRLIEVRTGDIVQPVFGLESVTRVDWERFTWTAINVG